MAIKKNKDYFTRNDQVDLLKHKSLQKNKYTKMMHKIKDFFATKTNSSELVNKEFEQLYDNNLLINFNKDNLKDAVLESEVLENLEIKKMLARINAILKTNEEEINRNNLFNFNEEAENLVNLLNSKKKDYEKLNDLKSGENDGNKTKTKEN